MLESLTAAASRNGGVQTSNNNRMPMKTFIALALFAFAASANATTYVYVKPAPVSCVGAACTIATKLAAMGAPVLPFDPTLVMSQGIAVAQASGACFYTGNNSDTAEILAVTGSNGFTCLSAPPTPQADSVGTYSWAVSQNVSARTWTQVFQVRTVNATTGVATWNAVSVPGAPTSADYKAYARQVILSHDSTAYSDGAQFEAFAYTAVLSGLTNTACSAIVAAGNSAATCSNGTMTASFQAPAFSSVGSTTANAASNPSWVGTVAYPSNPAP